MSSPTEDLNVYFDNVVNEQLQYLDDDFLFRSMTEETEKISNSENIRNQTMTDLCKKNVGYSGLQNDMFINHSKTVKTGGGRSFCPTIVRLSKPYENKICHSKKNIGPLDYSNNYRTNHTSVTHESNTSTSINDICKKQSSSVKEVGNGGCCSDVRSYVETVRNDENKSETVNCQTESENDVISREVISLMLDTVECILNWDNNRNNLLGDSEEESENESTDPVISMFKSSFKAAFSCAVNKERPNEGRKNFCCLECPCAFSSNANLANHVMRKHLNKTVVSAEDDESNEVDEPVMNAQTDYSNEKLLQCIKCKLYFSDKNELKIHALIHLKERRLKCNDCGVSFKKRRDLDEHSLLHNKKPARCEVCGKTFTQAGNMKIHLRIHTKEKPYTCELCGKSYTQSGDLKTHIRVHTDERPYLCEYCGNLFHSLSHLARHSKVHTKIKPYTCSVCLHSFGHAHHLKKHFRIHTQEKPYSCEICGKAFSRADYLKQHIRVHTKEKPYLCRICGKGFSQGGSLKLHQRVHAKKGAVF